MAQGRFSKLFSSAKTSNTPKNFDSTDPQIAVGRVVHNPGYNQILQSSSTLASMIFGANLTLAPRHWQSALAYGIVSEELAQKCLSSTAQEDGQCVVNLLPGWALGVAQKIPAHYLVIETKALFSGPWAGTLEPGGEHLASELFYLIKNARKQFITPVLIDSERLPPVSPASFSVNDTLTYLRKEVPARVDNFVPADPLSPAPSPMMAMLQDYSRGSAS